MEMVLNLDYIPNNINTVVIVNDFDYVEGGAAKVALMTAESLAKAGYKTFLFSAVSNKNISKIPNVNYVSSEQHPSLLDSNKIRGALNGIYNFKAKNHFKKLLKELDPKTTLIHIHSWTKALSSSIWDIAYSMNFPIYLTCHDYFSVCPNGGFYNYPQNKICHLKPLSLKCACCNCDSRNYGIKLYRLVRTFVQNKVVNIFKKTTKFISISDFSENVLKEHYPKEISFTRVYNPIDKIEMTEKINPENGEYFLFAGRLSKEKGCDLFCQAISDLGLKGIVVGEGEQKDALKKQFKNANIEFVGWKNRTEVFEYMKKARALVFPSRWYEAAPLTVPEALSIGLPCIVSDCCAARDYIKDEKDGCLFSSLEDLKRCLSKYEKYNNN